MALTDNPSNFIIGPEDRDLYFRAGSVPYVKLSTTGVLSAVNGGTIQSEMVSLAWVNVPYAAGTFTASGSMTWTVEAGDHTSYKYLILGKLAIVSIVIDATTVGGTPSTTLRVALPAALAPVGSNQGVYHYLDNTTYGVGLWSVGNAATVISFYLTGLLTNWTASTNLTGIRATLMFAIA